MAFEANRNSVPYRLARELVEVLTDADIGGRGDTFRPHPYG